MLKAPAKLTPGGNPLAVAIPKDLDASGTEQGDLRHAASNETMLDDAFKWSLGRYPLTYRDLAK